MYELNNPLRGIFRFVDKPLQGQTVIIGNHRKILFNHRILSFFGKSSLKRLYHYTTILKNVNSYTKKRTVARPFHFYHYSVRSATTGSFFAAALAGIKPLIKVKVILMTIIVIAELIGKFAKVEMPVSMPSRALTPTQIA